MIVSFTNNTINNNAIEKSLVLLGTDGCNKMIGKIIKAQVS